MSPTVSLPIAGTKAWISVLDSTVKDVDTVVAKSTAVAPMKLVPWMMIVVPPPVGALPP